MHYDRSDFFPFLDFVLGAGESLTSDFFGISYFCSTTMAVASVSPSTIAFLPEPPALFEGSTCPTSGISDASHCWKGLAMKNPSTSNQRVKGDESSIFFSSPLLSE